MSSIVALSGSISPELAGLRLDQALAKLFPDYSRSQLQGWIRAGYVTLGNQLCLNTKEKVLLDQTVRIAAPLPIQETWSAQAIPLDIVYEDESILVINKPAELVVHPGAGVPDQTLVNALLHHDPALATVPRAGIVHRLDKDTTGLLVVARTLPVHNRLIQNMKQHEIIREYDAIVNGVIMAGGTVEAPIARHPSRRTQMAVVPTGRPAITHYRVIKRYPAHSHLRIQLETGRTHQIRVHMAYIHHAVVGDPVYKTSIASRARIEDPLKTVLRHFPRQALHAIKLSLHHPLTQEWMGFTAPLPADMKELIEALEETSLE